MSLTVPDQGQSNAVIATDPHTKVETFGVTYLTRKYIIGEYRRVSFNTKEYTVELEDIMSAKHPVTSGSLFWKRAMQEVHNKTMTALMYEQDYAKTYDADERTLLSVKKNWMPMMNWKDDALILHAVPKGDLMNGNKTKAASAFSLDLGVAEKFGFIEKPKGWANYTLGPNLQFTCPTVTFDGQTPPKNPFNRTDYYWEGEHYARTQPPDLSPYQVRGTILGKSTMARYPLMHTSSPLLDPMILKHLKQRSRRRMKGGTIFGKSTRLRRRYPLMFPSASQVDPVQWSRTMARRRHGIKRTRR